MKKLLIIWRLCRLGEELRSWKQLHSLAAGALALAMVLVSSGCNKNSEKDAQEVQQLKAQVADLDNRMRETERLLQPVKSQLEQQGRQLASREKFNQRSELDRRKYSQDQLTEAEKMYQAAAGKWGSPECIETLNQMVEKFPDVNRTGCAVLYLAQNTTGPESEKYLRECIEKFNDCYYGDGVQVGAYARFYLANYYAETSENAKAQAMFKEIKDNYPDSIDHHGQLLVSLIK